MDRSTGQTIGATQPYLLGFDIGGTKCAVVVGVATTDGFNLLGRRVFATATAPTPADALARFEVLTGDLLGELGLSLNAFAALGLSCGGPLDSVRGVVLGPPNLPGWDYVPLVDHFGARLGLPTFLQNDADAGALAEWQWGAGRGSHHMIFLTFGTGMGAGLILNGQLYTGASGMAGEVGHVRLAADGPIGYGKSGSFEGFCSGGGIRQLAQRAVRDAWARGEHVAFCADELALAQLDARRIAEAAREGDPLAQAIVAQCGSYLGRGLALLIDILNPELIVIGSIFTRAGDLLWPHAQQQLAAEALPGAAEHCKVVPAALGEAIGDYAALAVAQYGLRGTTNARM